MFCKLTLDFKKIVQVMLNFSQTKIFIEHVKMGSADGQVKMGRKRVRANG